jgi:hypothetical protein
MTVLDLIRSDAAGVGDPSGKTGLDSQIEAWQSADVAAVANALRGVLAELDEHDWKQWRAVRQIIWRLKLRSQNLRDALAVLTEGGRPAAPRARFYAYLARVDLGNPPSMDELIADSDLRDQRPSEWLQLAFSQASPTAIHGEYLKLASKLSAADFTFIISRLREKYGDKFVEWMIELCRTMSFEQARALATLVDDEYHCGIYNEILASHPSIRGGVRRVAKPGLWEGLDSDFKHRITERV